MHEFAFFFEPTECINCADCVNFADKNLVTCIATIEGEQTTHPLACAMELIKRFNFETISTNGYMRKEYSLRQLQ